MRLGPTAQRELTKSRWQRKDSPAPNDLQGLYGDSPNLSVPMQLDPTERRGPRKAVPVPPLGSRLAFRLTRSLLEK